MEIFFAAAGLFAADAVSTNEAVTSPPLYVPDMSHANDPLPDGVLDWSSLMQTTNADADQASVQFSFSFTNVSPVSVTVLGAHASCSCTVAKLPPLPWTIPPGGRGEFSATVNVEGRGGILFKSVTLSTDKGSKELFLRITMLPPVIHILTDAERANGVAITKADRQAIFRDDCANCHAKPAQGKYGKPLYDAVCGICHEAEHRAEAVPDLHGLKTPTNDDFWRTWIAHGKPGSLMPAFSTAEGGPLTDMQIAALARYLDTAISPQFLPAATNAAPVN